ncbi:MAG: hypothetical protein H6Q33_2504 [Deltaproteobacteria bacterium]|nr:hypothetical protein [Deltaproteobacteria bacterium]
MTPIPQEILDLYIKKTHSGIFLPGQQGTWLLTVGNGGSLDFAGPVVVSDLINPPMALVSVSSADPNWDCSASVPPSQVSCTHPGPLLIGNELPPITVVVSVAPGAVGILTNTANVVITDSILPNNTATDSVRLSGPALAPVASPEGILALIAVLCAAAWRSLRRTRA